MDNSTVITILTSLGAPILVIIGGIISWNLKTRNEELKEFEAKARDYRLETYNKILNPLIILLTTKADQKAKDKAILEMQSVDYRKAGFNITTFGSDELVNAYNEMLQSFYKGEAEINPKESMRKFAYFLLCIRKDLYNNKTKLKEWDMLKFMITDIDKLIND